MVGTTRDATLSSAAFSVRQVVIGRVLGMRSSSVRQLGRRLTVLACYAVLAAAFWVLLLGPARPARQPTSCAS